MAKTNQKYLYFRIKTRFSDAREIKKKIDIMRPPGLLLNNFFRKEVGKYKNLTLFIVFDRNKLYKDYTHDQISNIFKMLPSYDMFTFDDLHFILEGINDLKTNISSKEMEQVKKEIECAFEE